MAFPLLGTAQLGMPYGIANRTGKPDRETAFAILEAAVEEGITAFDTAAAYGDSEAILGSFIEAHGLASSVRLVTKVKAHVPDEIDRAIDSSLRRLRVSKLSALLLHSMPDGESLFDIVEEMAERVDAGQVDSVGISVYETADALDVLRTPRLSITQVPTNLFDHRFIEAGIFDAGIRERKRVDVRSVFLQGLLAMSPDALPSHLFAAREPLRALEGLAAQESRAVLEIACAFVRDLPGVAGVLFGAETPEQVRMNARWWRSPGLSEELRAGIYKSFAHVPEAVIDPRLWPAA